MHWKRNEEKNIVFMKMVSESRSLFIDSRRNQIRFPSVTCDDFDEYFDSDVSLETEPTSTLHQDCEEEKDKDFEHKKVDKTRMKRGTRNFIDARLVAALDKCKVSNGYAVHLLTAVIAALGLKVSDYVVSRATIERSRKQYREAMAKKIKADFHETVI